MRVVVALGGNALLRRGQAPDIATQRANAERAARSIRPLVERHSLLVTHGNGPQVGLLALQAEASDEVPAYPLDVLGAESEGLIGYLLEQALRRALPAREVATLLTQVEVSLEDPAFRKPSKPIGPVYPAEQAETLREQRGWSLVSHPAGVRRVVASPEPLRILQVPTVLRLLEAGVLVICAGGGGIPVAPGPEGMGVEAVVDKDLSAALLAREIGAEFLLLLTDVAAVYRDWPAAQAAIGRETPDALRRLELEAGSMGPKVEAACRFVEATGGSAAIGALEQASAVLAGRAGTRIERGSAGPSRG